MPETAFLAPLAIVLALAGAALHAQVSGESEQTAQDTGRAPPTEAQDSREAPGQATEERTGDPSDARASSTESPFSYEPSEDISEDLSVSFPVDI